MMLTITFTLKYLILLILENKKKAFKKVKLSINECGLKI